MVQILSPEVLCAGNTGISLFSINQLDFISSFILPQSFLEFLFPESSRVCARDLRSYIVPRFPEGPAGHQYPYPHSDAYYLRPGGLCRFCTTLGTQGLGQAVGLCPRSRLLVHHFQPQPWNTLTFLLPLAQVSGNLCLIQRKIILFSKPVHLHGFLVTSLGTSLSRDKEQGLLHTCMGGGETIEGNSQSSPFPTSTNMNHQKESSSHSHRANINGVPGTVRSTGRNKEPN